MKAGLKKISKEVRPFQGLIVLLLFFFYLVRNVSARRFKMRPPGAGGNESSSELDSSFATAEFLARCSRCGQCATRCPERERGDGVRKAIQFSQDGFDFGSPYIDARNAACLMCEDTPCIEDCPTGALKLKGEIEDARMGTAELVAPSGCLSIQGLRCEVCYNRCPLRDKALVLQRKVNSRTGVHMVFEPVIDPLSCTGCGLCEQVCIQDEPVIKVREYFQQGEPQAHYKFQGF